MASCFKRRRSATKAGSEAGRSPRAAPGEQRCTPIPERLTHLTVLRSNDVNRSSLGIRAAPGRAAFKAAEAVRLHWRSTEV